MNPTNEYFSVKNCRTLECRNEVVILGRPEPAYGGCGRFSNSFVTTDQFVITARFVTTNQFVTTNRFVTTNQLVITTRFVATISN